ncbi:MAG TPA: SRPBCC domain-containing protein [Bacteroidia bacterium]|nr:SRPBCC domain-containing protein [Bacteroidia bacterium]
MTKTITQKVVFKNTTPKQLYELYMDAKKHSKVTGGPAKISTKEGAKYSTHGGYITGKNLRLVKDKLIVQAWRAQGWDKEDLDSTFVMKFEPKGKDVVLQMTHANIPEKHVTGIKKGWDEHYWKPWKNFLAGKPIVLPKM